LPANKKDKIIIIIIELFLKKKKKKTQKGFSLDLLTFPRICLLPLPLLLYLSQSHLQPPSDNTNHTLKVPSFYFLCHQNPYKTALLYSRSRAAKLGRFADVLAMGITSTTTQISPFRPICPSYFKLSRSCPCFASREGSSRPFSVALHRFLHFYYSCRDLHLLFLKFFYLGFGNYLTPSFFFLCLGFECSAV